MCRKAYRAFAEEKIDKRQLQKDLNHVRKQQQEVKNKNSNIIDCRHPCEGRPHDFSVISTTF